MGDEENNGWDREQDSRRFRAWLDRTSHSSMESRDNHVERLLENFWAINCIMEKSAYRSSVAINSYLLGKPQETHEQRLEVLNATARLIKMAGMHLRFPNSDSSCRLTLSEPDQKGTAAFVSKNFRRAESRLLHRSI
jgi:hypothetical protein